MSAREEDDLCAVCGEPLGFNIPHPRGNEWVHIECCEYCAERAEADACANAAEQGSDG